MTPTEFKQARLDLDLTPAQCLPLLGFGSVSRISEIENGRRGVSGSVAILMRAYLAGYRPENWPDAAA